MTTIIETKRLILRTWKNEDASAFFQISQDPKVNELLRGPLTMEQVGNFISRMNDKQAKYGHTLWAAELKETGQLIGYIGLNYTDWKSNFTPAVEVAWQLGSQFWGRGYATEGAEASLEYGFNKCELKEIVSFTVPANVRSIRVMEKIGLERDLEGNFANPAFPADHPLSHTILYRLSAELYLNTKNREWSKKIKDDGVIK